MDVKKTIKNELDSFTVTVVGVYGELITDDIPDSVIQKSVDKVTEAKDFAQGNLEKMAETIVQETIVAVKESDEAREARIKSLLPPDINTEATAPVAVTPPPPQPPAVVEDAGVTTPLPREVSGPNDAFTPPNMDHLVEAAEQAVRQQTAGVGGAGMVDVDMNVDINHDLMTVADENRLKQGLPPKGKGPVVNVTGKPLVQTQKEEPKKPEQNDAYLNALRKIGQMAANEEGDFAFKVLTVVEVATGENFTKTPEETDV